MTQGIETWSQLTPSREVVEPSLQPVTWRLHFVASPDRRFCGRVIALQAGLVVLGREYDPLPEVAVRDPALSRRHAALLVRSDCVEINDLGSRNGTFVAGRKSATARVSHGAVLRWGDTLAVLEADSNRALEFEQPTPAIPGQSEQARLLRAALDMAARGFRPVLVHGQTGVGKEFAVQELHQRSGRGGRLVRVNMPAVPESLFEGQFFGYAKGAFTGSTVALPGYVREAHSGTLMLDEIGDLPMTLQAKLLRLVEEGTVRPLGAASDVPIDVRFVAATNANLAQLAAQGKFRHDLLARLSVHSVEVPPLSERRADLLALADTVAPLLGQGRSWRFTLSARCLERLLLAPWKYNLRDLQAVLIRTAQHVELGWTATDALAIAMKALLAVPEPQPEPETAAIDVLPVMVRTQRRDPPTPATVVRAADPPPSAQRWRPSAQELRSWLKEHRGNIEHVAAALGRDRRQVYRWLDYAGISQDEVQRLRQLSADGAT